MIAARSPSAARRPWPALQAGVLALLLCDCGHSEPASSSALQGQERAWNVVLISIDTLRADHLSSYGYERETSPNLDRLASAGVLFEGAYAHAPKTAPSHMSLMTSVLPEVHRVGNRVQGRRGARLSPGLPTLAELLHDAGYQTVAFTSGGNVGGGLGFRRGFERYEHLSVDARESFGRAADWVAGSPSQPFFLFVHTYQTHAPYLPPPGYYELYTDPGYAGRIPGRPGAHRGRAPGEFMRLADFGDPSDVAHLQDLYDGCIRYVDDRLGSLLDALEEAGASDDTIVIVASDHGEEFLEHAGSGHSTLFDEVLRVPLIFRMPPALGDRPGLRVREPVGLVDVVPTILELLGLPPLAHSQGRSLLPLLRGEPDLSPRPGYAQTLTREASALRLGRFKLVRDGPEPRLFDLVEDPREQKPLENRPGVRRSLTAAAREIERESSLLSRGLKRPVAAPVEPRQREMLEALGYLDGTEEASEASGSRGTSPTSAADAPAGRSSEERALRRDR